RAFGAGEQTCLSGVHGADKEQTLAIGAGGGKGEGCSIRGKDGGTGSIAGEIEDVFLRGIQGGVEGAGRARGMEQKRTACQSNHHRGYQSNCPAQTLTPERRGRRRR